VRRLDQILSRRRALSATYDRCFQGTEIKSLRSPEPAAHTYQSYVVLLPPELASRRDDVIASLRREKIEATVGTHHVPLTKYYQGRLGHGQGDFPVTDAVAGRALTLPLHRDLSHETVCEVAGVLLQQLGQAGR
jgi:dTDP-4-amino-4,6-dideoxygalactose transaminase